MPLRIDHSRGLFHRPLSSCRCDSTERIVVGRGLACLCFPTFSVPNAFRNQFPRIPSENDNAANPSLTRHFEDCLLSMSYGAIISRKALHFGFFRPVRGQTIIFLMPPGAGSIPSAR